MLRLSADAHRSSDTSARISYGEFIIEGGGDGDGIGYCLAADRGLASLGPGRARAASEDVLHCWRRSVAWWFLSGRGETRD